jgi:DNA repair protein RadC
MARAKEIGEISSPRSIYELVRADLETEDQEVFVVVCLDFRGAVRDYVEIGRGQRHRVAVDIEDVLRPIIASGCDGAVVLHSHPSGIAEPSDADGDLTEAIRSAMKVSCPTTHLLDHIVVGMNQYYSFASNNWKTTGKVELVS